ncbi:4-hydroxy-tetrahydrodipicolinate synthase [Bernardetia sp. ABR2-2B]|uniref:4-hydroxy-tetrahydrodipicolinate synthase n=1 Tax=Bernardetia sp. ABR2-2B TaxID=3127472 RepID=UPI0030D53697
MNNLFRGTGIALVTPFDENKNVDFDALKNLLVHTQDHVEFWVVHGTTGEAATTTRQEKREIFDFIAANNPKKLPLVYGLAWNDTKQLIELIGKSNLEGVSALLSASPSYNKPTQEGIYRHYMEMADASPKPIILYNVPSRTASNIEAKTTLKLAQHPNIIGTKEASGDITQCIEILRNKPKDFMVFSGDDALTLPLISLGADGVIGVIPNAYPKEFGNLTRAALKGDYKTANEYLHQLFPLFEHLFVESNPVGIKEILALMDVMKTDVRLPLLNASKELSKKFETEMKEIKSLQQV